MANNADFLKLTKDRKTTYEFGKKGVKPNSIEKILEAGRWSPSCSNSQPWHFIIIKDKKRVEKLIQTANFGDFHDYPPLIIALVLRKDLCLGDKFSCFKGGPVDDSLMCTAMAGLNMVLEATDLGIDSCLLTPEPAKIKGVLKVKKTDLVPLMVGFGYEKERAYQKKRVRRPLKDIISYEYFGGK